VTAVAIAPSRASATTTSVRSLRSVEQVEAARADWAALGFASIDAHIDYFLAVTAAREEVERPHVLLLERGGVTEGMLVARLEQRTLPARFGYATVLRPTLRCLTVVHGGIAGSPSAVRELVRELLAGARAEKADAVFLHRAPVDGALYREICAQAPAACRQRFVTATDHWAARLPDSFEKFEKDLPSKLRGNWRRDGRKLLAEFGDRLEIRRVREAEHLERLVADLESVASKTYQRGLNAGFSASDDLPLVKLALERGWFNAWLMYLDGEPSAFELGHLYGGSFFLGARGFDPQYGRHGIGTFLQVRMLQDLCDDPAVHAIDFGFGDADYKRRCANLSWQEADLLVYSPAPRPLLVGAARNGVAGADWAARRLAGKERIRRIKRRWRDLRTPG